MNNNKKILKIIVAIIVAILIIAIIFIARKYIIINQLVEKQNEIKNSKNYSYVLVINKNGEEPHTITYYYKDGKSIQTGTKTGMISWHDENTKELITYSPETSEASVTSGEQADFSTIIQPIKAETFFDKLERAFTYHISTDKINDTSCFVIQQDNSICYYSKEDKTIIKYVTLTDNSTIDVKLNINNVTDEDILKPNLDGYSVTNNM